mmetsp:Transcript_61450/g.51981  ORF Transcript_61450/g.51981 Transcript_61450/m.51981 type:complete len:165 (-) Transcript_61450:82-576(-)
MKRGLSYQSSSLVITAMSVTSIIGRLFSGLIVEQIGAVSLFQINMISMSILYLVLYIVIDSTWIIVFICISMTLFIGSTYAQISSISAEILPPSYHVTGMIITELIIDLGIFCGVLASGSIMNEYGFRISALYNSICCLIASVLWFIGSRLDRDKNHYQTEEEV